MRCLVGRSTRSAPAFAWIFGGTAAQPTAAQQQLREEPLIHLYFQESRAIDPPYRPSSPKGSRISARLSFRMRLQSTLQTQEPRSYVHPTDRFMLTHIRSSVAKRPNEAKLRKSTAPGAVPSLSSQYVTIF